MNALRSHTGCGTKKAVKKILTKIEYILRERLRTNERALRAVLQEMRAEGKITDYEEEANGRGINWVRYRITPAGEKTNVSKPKITINLRSEPKGMAVGGNSRLIHVVFDRYLDMGEWQSLLEKQIEIRLRGWISEARVVRVAETLIAEPGNPVVAVAPASAHNDKENGIDIVLICNGNGGVERIPLQCKTGAFGQASHRLRNPKIPSLLIQSGITDRDIREKLLEIIGKYLSGTVVHR